MMEAAEAGDQWNPLLVKQKHRLQWPKKRPEICITVMARILHGAKFPLAHLYYYLLINLSDLINDITECRIMT